MRWDSRRRQRAAALFLVLLPFAPSCAHAAGNVRRSPYSDYPLTIYPSLIPVRHGVVLSMASGCPGPTGIERLGPPPTATIGRLLSHLGSGQLPVERHASDRTLWPLLATSPQRQPSHIAVSLPRSARVSPFAGIIERGCGTNLLRSSWYVALCPTSCSTARRRSPALIGYLFMIVRSGHWLVWAES